MNITNLASRNLLRSTKSYVSRSSKISGYSTSCRFFSSVTTKNCIKLPTPFNSNLIRRSVNKSELKNSRRRLATDAIKTDSAVSKKVSKTAGDIFLDNIGTVFLSAIGLLILTLVRSSYGTSNKTSLRQRIEAETVLDPFEIDDLRTANDQMSPEVFRNIYSSLRDSHGWTLSQKVDYTLFVSGVRHVMKEMKGDAFTIQLGHLLDRVVADITEKIGKEEVNTSCEEGLEFSLLLTALSLAMNGPIRDRVEILYDILKNGKNDNDDLGGMSADNKSPSVKENDVIQMVKYLQQTCQLVPDAQIVESDVKYPAQQYKIGSPLELVRIGKEMKKEEISSDVLASGDSEWTCDDLHHLLRSKSVCAWGECYVKKKGLH